LTTDFFLFQINSADSWQFVQIRGERLFLEVYISWLIAERLPG
jgi:hypothetical protein